MAIKIGTKVKVNRFHAGCEGSTGTVMASETISGHRYYNVKLTGGKGASYNLRFTARELDIIKKEKVR